MPTIHRITIDLLLAAVTDHVGEDGLMHSFLFSRDPHLPSWNSSRYVTIFFSHRSMVKAALFVQSRGPVYIRSLSIDDIMRMLQGFLKKHFTLVARETLFNGLPGNYAEIVSDTTKALLALALENSEIFSPVNALTLFPLVTINVEQDFTSTHYFFSSTESLSSQVPPELRSQMAPNVFPPIRNTEMRSQASNSWLGVRSPLLQTSVKMKTAIMGATALSLPLNARYMFSLRKVFGGYCTFSKEISFSFGDSHTPPISRNLVIRQCDQSWLDLLSKKLSSPNRDDRRHIRALEYFYRAWTQGNTDRFPFLCMALDALYSEARKATKSVIDGIHDTLGTRIDEKRLRMLIDLRASVIHGGAPDVIDSSKYRKYYQEFLSDPIDDLDDVFTESMRRRLFGGAFKMQTDNDASAIAALQQSGRLPRGLGRNGILNDT